MQNLAVKATTYQGAPCKRGHAGVRRVRGGDCIECSQARARERWNREPGYKDKWLAQRRDAYATAGGRRYRRERNLIAHYGLTISEYEKMLVAQNYECALCPVQDWENPSGLVVDHDHETGAVRALLCTPCNLALGGLRDSPQLAEQAAAYLRKHGRI